MSQMDRICQQIVADWNACHGAFYRIRETDLLWHRSGQNWVAYQAQILEDVPFLYAESTEQGRAAGVSAKTLWLCLWGKIPEGREPAFADALLALAAEKGKTRLCVGGDEFQFLPGIPVERTEERFLAALKGLSFQLHDASDFAGSLRGAPVSAYIREAELAARKNGWRLVPGGTGPELDRLGSFLAKEFAGRWEREFRFWRQDPPGAERARWNLLLEPEGGIIGFARLSIRGGLAGGWLPGALRLPLLSGSVGDPSDSSLGPIGVAASGRGKGVGKVLLGLSLQYLLANDAELVCIDWTNAYNYYMPLGLPRVRSYQSAIRDF